MHDVIIRAIERTFRFNGWTFANEFEFKHELFHQLAQPAAGEASLAQKVAGTPTCILHAEGKVVNGNPKKADLLLCDPNKQQTFNYEVEYVIELKQTLTRRLVSEEIEKLRSYGRHFKGYYLTALNTGALGKLSMSGLPNYVHILDRSTAPSAATKFYRGLPAPGLEKSLEIIYGAIEDTLQEYGRERRQYHSFFWCNYEHETWRGHSFPCEGDFNAHLYHRLRSRLPSGIEIRSEVRPERLAQRRIDFVLCDATKRWAVPIDVKMNWDQFKPSFKLGLPRQSEAHVILDRMNALYRSYAQCHPMLVVIQDSWQLPRNVKSHAEPLLSDAKCPVELLGFDEDQERVVCRKYGSL